MSYEDIGRVMSRMMIAAMARDLKGKSPAEQEEMIAQQRRDFLADVNDLSVSLDELAQCFDTIVALYKRDHA